MTGTAFNLGIRLTVDGTGQVVASVKSVEKSLASIKGEANKASEGLASIKGEANKASEAAKNLSGRLVQLAAVVGIGLSAREFVQQADAMSLLDARLRNAVGGAKQFAEAQQAVYEIAQKNNIGLQEATQLYVRLAAPVSRLGGTTKEVTGITNAFAMSLRVGGASAMEAASATLQFAQAMGSGKLSGDEFRAMAEASPRFMQALAEGMGKPIETLKKMGAEGKLTADVVGNALIKSLDKLTQEAKTLPDTVGGAMTRIRNDVLVAISDLNKSSGLTLGIAGLLEVVRKDLVPALKDDLTAAFETVGQFITDNRDRLIEAWEVVEDLAVDVLEIAKALGIVVMETARWALQSGLVLTSLQTARLLVAGLQDGVQIVAASFAHVGSAIWQFLVSPITKAGPLIAAVVGVFNGDLAKKIMAHVHETVALATAGEKYAAGITEKFAAGETAVGKLNAEMAKSKKDTEAATAALKAGALSTSEIAAEMAKLGRQADTAGKGFKKLESAIKPVTDEQKEAAKTHEKLLAGYDKMAVATAAKLSTDANERAAGVALTDAQSDYVKVMLDVVAGKVKLTDLEKKGTLERLKANLVTSAAATEEEKLKEAKEKLAVTMSAVAAHSRKMADEEAAATATLREGNVALIEQNATLLLNEAELVDRQVALLLAAAAEKEMAAGTDESNYHLREQARLLRARAGLIQEGVVLKEAKQAADEWEKVSDQIGEGLTDSLFRAFEAGKGFFETLMDGIKNTFKTTVLKLIIDPVQKTISGVIGNFITGGAGGGTGGLSQYMQGASTLSSMYGYGKTAVGTVGSWLGYGGGGAAAYGFGGATGVTGAGMYGTTVTGSTLGTAGGGFGLTAGGGGGSGAGLTLGASGGGTGAGLSYTGGTAGTVATATPTAGMSAGAVTLWAAAIAAGVYKANQDWNEGYRRDQAKDVSNEIGGLGKYAIGSGAFESEMANMAEKMGFSEKLADLFSGATAVAKLFGRAAPRITGSGVQGTLGGGDFTGQAYADVYEKGGLFRKGKSYQAFEELPQEIERFMDGAAAGIMAKAKEYGEALGLPVESLAGVTTDIKVQIGDDAAKNKEAIETALGGYGDALVASWEEALKPLAIMGETAVQTIERVGGTITGVNEIFGALGITLLEASIAGGQAATSLVDAFGGGDEFAQSLSGFFGNYYSEAEKAALSTKGITDALAEVGIALPETNVAFRDMVTTLLNKAGALTEEEQAQLVALLKVEDAFATLNPLLDETGATVAQMAATFKSAMGQLDGETRNLGVDLRRAGGDETGARALEREIYLDGVGEISDAQREALGAAYDYNQSLRDQIAVLDKAAEAVATFNSAAADLKDQGLSLDAELLRAQGDDAGADTIVRDQYLNSFKGLTETQREALGVLYDYNKSVQDQIDVVNDGKKALETFNSAMGALEGQSASLEAELLRASGNEAEARKVERAAYLAGFAELSDTQREALGVQYDHNQSIRDNIDAIKDNDAAVKKSEQAWKDLNSAIDANIGAFQTPEEQTQYQYAGLSTKLAGAGVDLDVGTLMGMSKDELLEFATAFVKLTDVSVESKTAVVEVVGALGGMINKAESAAQAIQDAIDGEALSILKETLTLQGKSVDLAKLERDAIAEANLPAYDRLVLLRAEKVASDELKAATALRVAEEKATADERYGLETRLLTLQGDTVALRARERESYQGVNRDIYDQIVALEDLAEATRIATAEEDKLKAKRDAVASEKMGLERQLLALQGDTMALRALDRAALDESNRDLFDVIQGIIDYNNALDLQEATLQKAKDAMETARRGLESALGGVRAAVDAEKDRIQGIYDDAIENITRLANAWTTAMTDLEAAGQRLWSTLNTAMSGVETAAQTERNQLTGDYDTRVGAINTARGVVDGAMDALRTAVGAVIDSLTTAYEAEVKLLDERRTAADAAYDAVYKRATGEIEAVNVQADTARDTYTEAAELLQAVIDSAGETVKRISALNDALLNTIKAMTPKGGLAERATAQQQISAALAQAQATGVLPDAESLQDALSIVSRDAADMFGSETDYLRDLFRTINDVTALQSISGGQLATAETELSAAIASKKTLDDSYQIQVKGFDDARKASQNEINAAAIVRDDLVEAIELEQGNLTKSFEEAVAFQNGILTTAIGEYNEAMGIAVLGVTEAVAGLGTAITDYKTVMGDDTVEGLTTKLNEDLADLDAIVAAAKLAFEGVTGVGTSTQTLAGAVTNLETAIASVMTELNGAGLGTLTDMDDLIAGQPGGPDDTDTAPKTLAAAIGALTTAINDYMIGVPVSPEDLTTKLETDLTALDGIYIEAEKQTMALLGIEAGIGGIPAALHALSTAMWDFSMGQKTLDGSFAAGSVGANYGGAFAGMTIEPGMNAALWERRSWNYDEDEGNNGSYYIPSFTTEEGWTQLKDAGFSDAAAIEFLAPDAMQYALDNLGLGRFASMAAEIEERYGVSASRWDSMLGLADSGITNALISFTKGAAPSNIIIGGGAQTFATIMDGIRRENVENNWTIDPETGDTVNAPFYSWATGLGLTNELVDTLMNKPRGYALARWKRPSWFEEDVPEFALGGLHSGGLRLVGEQGPELEVTGPARYFSAQQTMSMLQDPERRESVLVAEIRALRAEVQGLRVEAKSSAVSNSKTARLLDRFDADGLPPERLP